MPNLLFRPWFARAPVMHRTRQIVAVFTRHGLDVFLHGSGLHRYVVLRRKRPGSAPPPLTQAEHLRLAFGELGATFIKLGQTLSTRGDLIPPDFATELAKLQDAAPPVPCELVHATITAELGHPPEELFARFDREPMASASIGQVHAATLKSGREVVVKVQRPGVAEEIERDLEILSGIAHWASLHTPFGRDYDLPPLADEFAYTLRNELDYRREGQNAERFRRMFEGDSLLRVPRVYWDYTTPRVLTLERMSGIKISDLGALDRAGIDRPRIAENAVRIFMREALEYGFLHADPHPGNFFVQCDASIALVDYGMVGRLSEALRLRLMRAGLAAIQQDAEGLAEELYALGVAGRQARRQPFQRDLDHMIGRYSGFSVRDVSAARVTSELTALAFRHRLQLPSELAMLFRVVAMSEGLGLMVHPDFRFMEFAAPLIKKQWRDRHSLISTAQRLKTAAGDAVELGAELPRRTARLLGRVERGDLEFNIKHEGLGGFLHELQRMTNRLALAVILGASIVALGFTLGIRHPPGLEPYVSWFLTLALVFSIGFGIWLVLSIWRAGRR